MSLFSLFPFALRRLWSHGGLALCLLVGLTTAVALVTAVPFYADGIHFNLLNSALGKADVSSLTGVPAETSSPANTLPRSAFRFIFHYVGSWYEPINAEKYAPIDEFMRQRLAGVIGLPSHGFTRYISTDNLQLYPDLEKINRSKRLELVKLASISGILEHIEIVAGKTLSPTVSLSSADQEENPPLEALAPLALANDLGLEVGVVYLLYKPASGEEEAVRLRVRIAGLWLPVDPADGFWFYPPESFDKRLIIPEETFFGVVAKKIPLAVNEAVWSFDLDGSGVHSENVPGLLERIAQAQTQANAILPHTDLETSPALALSRYRRDAQQLAVSLFAFSAPALGLVLYFLGQIASMLVHQQRSEIAILRSRGASQAWIVGAYVLSWLLLGGAALAGGVYLGWRITAWVGQTRSFLDFTVINAIPANYILRPTPMLLGLGLGTIALAILFSVPPAWQAGKDTIVSYKQERARALRHPWWQRLYLDIWLLLPTLYGLYLLQKEGRLKVLGRTLGTSNPFDNPLLFLLPSLFILALSLLALRILPRLFVVLAWLFERLPGVSSLIALRQLSRSTASHLGLMLLMIITLSLAGFVASMAHSLDRYLADSAYYAAGADLNLVESGEYTGEAPTAPDQPGAPPTPPRPQSDEPAVWNFLPVTDHLALPGVLSATRVGRYEAEISAGGRRMGGLLLGIDRAEFPAVAFFRDDFASEPFVALLNRLAYDPAALLVDRSTWEKFHFNTGDQVEIEFTSGERFTASFKVAGVVEYFPTLYPEEGPFFLANLEYLFEVAGGLHPYDVWLRTTPEVDAAAIVRSINELGITVVSVRDARTAVAQAYASPNRQGMLGLLTVGFLAAMLLTVIGFFYYTLLSFQERFVQLGILRAVGLSTWQMGVALALEQVLIILLGLGAGTGIAVLTARLFIPYLPVNIGLHPGTPPYVVSIAWGDITSVYLVFSAMLLIGIITTVVFLARMKIFQAVKLGDSL